VTAVGDGKRRDLDLYCSNDPIYTIVTLLPSSRTVASRDRWAWTLRKALTPRRVLGSGNSSRWYTDDLDSAPTVTYSRASQPSRASH